MTGLKRNQCHIPYDCTGVFGMGGVKRYTDETRGCSVIFGDDSPSSSTPFMNTGRIDLQIFSPCRCLRERAVLYCQKIGEEEGNKTINGMVSYIGCAPRSENTANESISKSKSQAGISMIVSMILLVIQKKLKCW